jgi:lipid II:glycine glycyltransferase (peptidoglycan interpeptide bridge formation enzyme)
MDNSKILEIIKKDFRQSNEWAEYISKLGFKPKILKNNSIIHEFKLGPFTILKSFRPELNDEAIDEIQSIADSKINLICKISPNIDFEETKMVDKGYQIVNSTMSPIRTCVRDLSEDYDSIFKSFSENTRYKINRSIREKDVVEIIQKPTDKDIDNFYDLLEKRQKENKFMTYSRKEIKILRNCFKDNSFLITTYDIKGNPVVSNLYLRYLDKVSYFAGSLNSENHKSKGGYQLINEAFKYFKSQGVKVYDFEGLSDERDPTTYQDWIGYTNFKLKFGNKIFTYPVAVIKYNNFIFKNLLKVFRII